jgi:hypothetical protein
MVSRDSHLVLPFAQDMHIRLNIEVLADLREVKAFFQAEEMHVSCVVERIRFRVSEALLVEANAEFTLADCSTRVWTTGETTLVRCLVWVARGGVSWDGLDSEYEARVLAIVVVVGVVKWMIANVFGNLLCSEGAEGFQLAVLGILKELFIGGWINRTPGSRRSTKRLVELCRIEVPDVFWTFVLPYLHASFWDWSSS